MSGLAPDLAVEPPGPQQRGSRTSGRLVAAMRMTPCSPRSRPSRRELVQRLLALVVAAAEAGAAMTADGVDFVDEDDAGRVLLGLLEHVAHAAGADADEHLDEVGTEMVKNGTLPHPAMARASSVLPVPGGPTSERAPGSCRRGAGTSADRAENSTILLPSLASSMPATSLNVTGAFSVRAARDLFEAPGDRPADRYCGAGWSGRRAVRPVT